MGDLFTWWALTSDAARLASIGVGCWLFAGFAALMEWRRGRKRGRVIDHLERVGWVPWIPLFLMGAMIGGGCLAMSLPVVLATL